MTYAIYAESDGYVHLVSAHSVSDVLNLLTKDIHSVAVKYGQLFNVYACKDGDECPDLEDIVNKYIKENK